MYLTFLKKRKTDVFVHPHVVVHIIGGVSVSHDSAG